MAKFDDPKVAREYQRLWRKANPESVRASGKKYREKNKAKLIQKRRDEYRRDPELSRIKSHNKYEKHKTYYRAYADRWWKEHPEKLRAKWKRHYLAKRDKRLEKHKLRRLKRLDHYRKVNREWQSREWAHRQRYMRGYHERNKDKIRAKVSEYYQKNKARYWNYAQKRRALKLQSEAVLAGIQAFVQSVKRKRFAYCYWCGEKVSTKEIHFDHIIPLAKGGQHSIENICVSCAPCNLSKNDKLVHRWNKLPELFLEL